MGIWCEISAQQSRGDGSLITAFTINLYKDFYGLERIISGLERPAADNIFSIAIYGEEFALALAPGETMAYGEWADYWFAVARSSRERVREIAAALAAVNFFVRFRRFCERTGRPDLWNYFSYYEKLFLELHDFYRRAAANHCSVECSFG